MKLIEALSNTPNANARFKQYYVANNWSLKIPLEEFLRLDFRYQLGTFLDYLAKENIGILITHSGVFMFILDRRDADQSDVNAGFIFTETDDGTLIIHTEDIVHEKHVKTADLMIQDSYKTAILRGFEFIHAAGKGYSVKFNNILQ